MIKIHPSYLYAQKVVKKQVNAPKYVIKQAKEFLRIADGKDKKYCINESTVELIDALLRLFIMPTGSMAGRSIYDATIGYQWLLYIGSLCTVWRSDTSRRRYQTAVLEICRKNFKTFSIAVLFLILFFIEPMLSKFFSVAPDGVLSKEVQNAIKEIIQVSPALRGDPDLGIAAKFKVLRDYTLCIPTQNKFTPLACSTNRMDGKKFAPHISNDVSASRKKSGKLNNLLIWKTTIIKFTYIQLPTVNATLA